MKNSCSPTLNARQDDRLQGSGVSKIKGGALTVGHESNDGVRGSAVVGRGTLIGYNSKQGDRSVGREAKDGA